MTGPYSRVYHSIVDDDKFASVYDDDRRLATWLRLLIAADQAYPASAHIPMGCHRPSVVALADAGLIDLGTGSRFRLHGLVTEREMRSQSARNAAAVRWHPNGNAKPMLDETRQDETSNTRASARTKEPWKSEFRAIVAKANGGFDVHE
jgi:hypothetical protein